MNNLPSTVSRNFRAYRSLDLTPLSKLCKIAHVHGIAIDLWSFGEYLSACLWKSSTGWRIVLNVDESQARRTFSLAHELGHYFIHRHHGHVQFWCSGRVDWGIEREANIFAEHLLMPSRIMIPLARSGMDAAAIADKLELSEQAVRIRLDTIRVV